MWYHPNTRWLMYNAHTPTHSHIKHARWCFAVVRSTVIIVRIVISTSSGLCDMVGLWRNTILLASKHFYDGALFCCMACSKLRLLTRHIQQSAQWSPDPFTRERVGSGHYVLVHRFCASRKGWGRVGRLGCWKPSVMQFWVGHFSPLLYKRLRNNPLTM